MIYNHKGGPVNRAVIQVEAPSSAKLDKGRIFFGRRRRVVWRPVRSTDNPTNGHQHTAPEAAAPTAAMPTASRMMALASSLAHLLAAVDAQAPKTRTFACVGGRCVISARGLPLAECQQVCAPSPSANYTCTAGQCVVSGRGLPLAQCTQVCGGPGPAPAPSGNTIVDIAVATPDLSVLVTALKAGDLVGTLSGNGPFTVFAPTNEAFAALPAGALANLLKPENKAQLVNVLTYHVVAGAVRAEDLKDGEKVKTVEGEELTVRIDGKDVFINSAKVVRADVNASNGVVHIIDSVLLPSDPAPPPGPPGPGPPPPGPPPGPAPKGCTKAGCYFSYTWVKPLFGRANYGGRCGEVDAAPRMPDDIWTDPKAVTAYVQATIDMWSDNFLGPMTMSQKPCEHNRAWVQNGTKEIDWLGTIQGNFGFPKFCSKRCKCSLPGDRKPQYPACTDKPDQPPYYCSLCGPKFNAPIEIKFWYPTGLAPPPPPCTPGGTPETCNIVALVCMNTDRVNPVTLDCLLT